MNTINEYINNYKKRTFDMSPFNDVDNIIFATLSYIDFEGVIEENITMQEIGKKYFSVHDDKYFKTYSLSIRKIINNFRDLYNTPRYKDIVLSNYIDLLDDKIQFSAVCFTLPDKTLYVSFEGTDDSMTGWHEDFDMIHKFPVPSQEMAINYLNNVIKFKHTKVLVGGHSKGGNLAMTAAMYTKWYNRHKIKVIYNNDGPGFRKDIYNSKKFKKILPKIKMFVPQHCVVGFLLNHPTHFTVVKSIGLGLYQHDSNNWLCYGDHFIDGDLTTESVEQENRMNIFLNKYNDTEKQEIVETLFTLFNKAGMHAFSDITNINIPKLIRLVKVSRTLDNNTKKLLLDSFAIMLINKVALKNE